MKVLIFILCMFACGVVKDASADDKWSILVTVASTHIGGESPYNYNEFNPGIGAEYNLSGPLYVPFGFYFNSFWESGLYKEPRYKDAKLKGLTFYGGLGARWQVARGVALGGELVAGTGYHKINADSSLGLVLLPVPMATFSITENVHLKTAYIPGYDVHPHVLAFQLKVDI